MKTKIKEKVLEWNGEVVKGLLIQKGKTNGKTKGITFWKKRANLYNIFNLCVLNLVTGQDYKSVERELKRIVR